MTATGVGLGEPVAVEVFDRRAGSLTEGGLDDLLEGTLTQAHREFAVARRFGALEEAHQDSPAGLVVGGVEDDADGTLVGTHLAGGSRGAPPRAVVDEVGLDDIACGYLLGHLETLCRKSRIELDLLEKTRRDGDDDAAPLVLGADGRRDGDGATVCVDGADRAGELEILAETLREVASDLDDTALDALLLEPTVDGDEGFQVHPGVGLRQTIKKCGVVGKDPEGTPEKIGDVFTSGVGTHIRDHPLTQGLIQPRTVRRRPTLVVGDPIGQTAEP